MARHYDQEFKNEAVQLVKEGRRIRDVERSLGITIGILKHWIKADEQEQKANVVQGKKSSNELKMRALEKEVATLRRERDILKKAVAIFSKEPNQYTGS